MNQNKQICTFYLKGHCKFGDKCKNLHPPNPGPMQAPQIGPSSSSSSHTCSFFLKNACTKKDCHYFH